MLITYEGVHQHACPHFPARRQTPSKPKAWAEIEGGCCSNVALVPSIFSFRSCVGVSGPH